MADLTTPSSFFRINNITLKVPPKSISIIKQDFNASVSTLRSQISTHVKSGHRAVGFVLETYFADGHNALSGEDVDGNSWVNDQLAPLIVQARKCPFVSIENEKIRKEMIGTTENIEGVEIPNMAAVIKSITIDKRTREPGIYNVRIYMEWFNYLPFSRNFGYKDISQSGTVREINVPGNQFESFYKYGAERTAGGVSRLVNTLDPSTPGRKEEDLEIIYKEYTTVGMEVDDYEAVEKSILDQSLKAGGAADKGDTPLRADIPELSTGLNELLGRGWTIVDDFESSATGGIILSRYRKFVIPAIDPTAELESGRLILESAVSNLETKAVTIPLLSHSMPTAQFLGAADGSMTLNFFANAEQENKKAIGTSNKLGLLNRIIEVVNTNAILYRRFAKNDSIFIKHPMASLLKYKRYDEDRVDVINIHTEELDVFDPNEYLSCIIQSTESHTVDSLPYCSRFAIKLTENYRGQEGTSDSEAAGQSGDVHEATKGLLKTLIDKYDIQPRRKKDLITTSDTSKEGKERVIRSFADTSQKYVDIDASRKGVVKTDPDFKVAQRLKRYLDATLQIKDFDDSKDIIDDPDLTEKSSQELDKEYEASVGARDIPSLRDLPDEELARVKATGTLEEIRAVANDLRRKRHQDFSGTASNRQPLSSERMNDIAWDILRILSKKGEGELVEFDPYFVEFKRFNLVSSENSYPDMMLPDPLMQPDFFFYNTGEVGSNTYKKKALGPTLDKYEEESSIFAEQVLNADAVDKTFTTEEFRGSFGPPSGASNLLALGEDKKRKEGSVHDKAYTQDPLNMDLQMMNITNTIDNFKDITYTMRRSMPTFRLFVREGDISSFGDIHKKRLRHKGKNGLWRNFTEFYDVNAVVDIRLVKSKDNPADLLIIRISNTKDDIVNKAYQDLTSKLERTTRADSLQTTESTSEDISGRELDPDINQLDAVMIKEGARIELRLGYEGNPNDLTVEFSGRVSQIGGGDVVEMVCQGDGIELVQELKGVGQSDDFTWNSNTPNMINELLHLSPEVKSFGTINAKTALADIPLFWKPAGGRTVVENIFAPSLFSTWSTLGSKTAKWAQRGVGLGLAFKNPYAAGVLGFVGGVIGFGAGVKDSFYKWWRGSKFVIFEQTIWEVLQELTLRHPGIICDVVNFDRRSTIFFGYPDQMYFHRGPTFKEAVAFDGPDSEGAGGLVEKNLQEYYINKTGLSSLNNTFSKKHLKERIALSELDDNEEETKNSVILDENGQTARFINLEGGEITPVTLVKDTSIGSNMMKSYRDYHMITSMHDIVENGMIVNSDGVYNSIQVAFPDSSGDGNYDGSEGYSGYEVTNEIKGDDDLNRDFIKRQTLAFHNAHNDNTEVKLAEQYAVSSLCKSLNNVYKGKIKILGRPGIKPHDVVFVYDTYNRIYGPVEVAAVIHTMSYETGWVTEIIPHMIVTPTTSTAVLHINAIQRFITSFALKNISFFYSGPIFNNEGELENDLHGETLTKAVIGSEAIDGLTDGIAIAGIGGATARIGKGLTRMSRLSGAAKGARSAGVAEAAAATGVRAKLAAKSAGVAKKAALFGKISGKAIAGGFLMGGLFIAADIAIDYATDYYINWSKFRQPIIFLPVTRNGKPWYTSLYGINNNTEKEALVGVKKELFEKADFHWEFLKTRFKEAFD